jgi:dienelactone hydrolase
MPELAATDDASGQRRPRWMPVAHGDRHGHTAAAPPRQPASGPGGAEYVHAALSQELVGLGAQACWVFAPAGTVPAGAPVVVFFHGWAGLNPANYGGWIVHLVRRGAIVLYPVYQASLIASFPAMMADAITGVRVALSHLQRRGLTGQAQPRMAFAGHSLGGLIAAKCAAFGTAMDLPVPACLMLVQPGWGLRFTVDIGDLANVDSSTLAVLVIGEDDLHLPSEQPRLMFDALSAVPVANRNLLLLRSDHHGTPPLVADHSAPLSERLDVGPRLGRAASWVREHAMRESGIRRPTADAHDFYAHWKLLDALMNAGFAGRDRDVALGNTAAQRYMGTWSDGTPVKELIVLAGAGA